MTPVESAIPLVLAAAAMLAGGNDGGWLLALAAVGVVFVRRWEGFVFGLPGAAAVAAGLAAEGLRLYLVVAALALAIGGVVVALRREPAEPLDAERAIAAAVGSAFVVVAGWTPFLDLQALRPYRDGAVLALATAVLVVAVSESTAVRRARSGKMEDPAAAGDAGTEPGA